MDILKRHWPIVALWALITTVVAIGPLKHGELEGIAYVDFPGIVAFLSVFGVHGGFGDWRDDAVIVVGSTVPWSLGSIFFIEVGRFLYKKYRQRVVRT